MVDNHSEQQLQEEMIEDFVEVVEGLSESSNIGVSFWPWKKEEQIIVSITEEGSGKEEIEEPQKSTAQAKKSPLPVHILPSPAAQPMPKTPTTKATQFALPALKSLKKLVATVRASATT